MKMAKAFQLIHILMLTGIYPLTYAAHSSHGKLSVGKVAYREKIPINVFRRNKLNSSNAKIVGGSQAAKDEYPFMVQAIDGEVRVTTVD